MVVVNRFKQGKTAGGRQNKLISIAYFLNNVCIFCANLADDQKYSKTWAVGPCFSWSIAGKEYTRRAHKAFPGSDLLSNIIYVQLIRLLCMSDGIVLIWNIQGHTERIITIHPSKQRWAGLTNYTSAWHDGYTLSFRRIVLNPIVL